MKKVFNEFLRFIIGFGLRSYYKEIKIVGLENIPKNKPLLILPNHQNGLIDPILIGTLCPLKPYYLARSDVFKNPLANWFLRTIQMLPIYRIRDGRNSLDKNEVIFNHCAQLLLHNENLIMFPEGSHGIDRRVRILKNGFYHIVRRVLEQDPETDLQLLPIGFNYQHLEQFPDRVSIHIGEPLSVQELIATVDESDRLKVLKNALRASLIKLTTHIEDQKNYAQLFEFLQYSKVDYLEPEKNNELIASYTASKIVYTHTHHAEHPESKSKFYSNLLYVLNFPIVLLWKYLFKPQRLDLEFVSTFRFVFAAIGYVLVMSCLFLISFQFFPGYLILIGMVIHYLLSRLLIKNS